MFLICSSCLLLAALVPSPQRRSAPQEAGAPAAAERHVEGGSPASADRYEALAKSYDAALVEWELADSRARAAGRKAKDRPPHPAEAWYLRFGRLAEEGDGRAMLWMARHLRDGVTRSAARRDEARSLFERLLGGPEDPARREEALLLVPECLRDLRDAPVVEWCRDALASATTDAERAAATAALAEALDDGGRSKDEARVAEARALRERAWEEQRGTRGAALAGERLLGALLEELSAEQDAFYAKLQAAEASGTPVDPSEDPTPRYWARVEELAAGGVLPAHAWLIQNTWAVQPGPEGPSKRMAGLLRGLIALDPDAPEALDVAAQLGFLVYSVERADLEPVCREWLAQVQRPLARARVAYGAGVALGETADGDAQVAEAVALLEEAARLDPGGVGRQAAGQARRIRDLRVGLVAPELVAVDVDGEELRLTELRGQVVVLDFWGFW